MISLFFLVLATYNSINLTRFHFIWKLISKYRYIILKICLSKKYRAENTDISFYDILGYFSFYLIFEYTEWFISVYVKKCLIFKWLKSFSPYIFNINVINVYNIDETGFCIFLAIHLKIVILRSTSTQTFFHVIEFST